MLGSSVWKLGKLVRKLGRPVGKLLVLFSASASSPVKSRSTSSACNNGDQVQDSMVSKIIAGALQG